MAQFEDLDVWKRSARLSADIYKELAILKDYGFRDQITRSCLSIPSIIAEGMGKASGKEKVRFLDIAKSSTAELRTQIYIGIDIGYIDKQQGKFCLSEVDTISKMLHALMQSIKKRA